jgi:hypothetical protein
MGVLKDAVQAVIAAGMEELERKQENCKASALDTQRVIDECKSKIDGLVRLSQDINPATALDRFQHILVGVCNNDFGDAHNPSVEFRINGSYNRLDGIIGGHTLARGKYRVVCMMERLEE